MSPLLFAAMTYPWWARIGAPLADHLWQSTLFAAIAGLLTLLLAKNHASTRYSIWLIASLKFLIPFSLLMAVGSHFQWAHQSAPSPIQVVAAMGSFGEPFAIVNTASRAIVAKTELQVLVARMLPAMLLLLWCAGFVSVLSYWLFRLRGITAVARNAKTLQEGRECSALCRADEALNVSHLVRVARSDAVFEPGILGIFHPVLLLPAGITERLSDAQLDAVIVHELCHVRRRDNLAAALHMFVEALFWFHPLVWWLGARLLDERERACDEAVLRLGIDPQIYSESILKICEFYVESPLLCASGVTGSSLKKRIEVIMRNRSPLLLSFPRKLLLGCALALALAIPFTYGVFRPATIRAQTLNSATFASASDTLSPKFPFESVSIRLDKDASGMFSFGWFAPNTFSTKGANLYQLIGEAYGVESEQILGAPPWANSDRYDINAKLTESEWNKVKTLDQDSSTREYNRVLQQLIAERFNLVLHQETKLLPAYVLRVTSDGPKLHPATPGDTYPSGLKDMYGKGHAGLIEFDFQKGKLVFQGVPISKLAKLLATAAPQHLDRIVVDDTGLSGKYDFVVGWTPTATEGTPDPSLVKALEDQLGLTLEAKDAVIPVVVVDHADQPASD